MTNGCYPRKETAVILAAVFFSALLGMNVALATGGKQRVATLKMERLKQDWPRLANRDRIRILMAMVRAGHLNEAERLIDTTQFKGGSALDAQFLRALILKREGSSKKPLRSTEKYLKHTQTVRRHGSSLRTLYFF